MITKENLKLFFDALTEDQINTVMDSAGDYVAGYITGNVGMCIIEAIEILDEETEEEVYSSGGFICDKDDFLRLFKESESVNPYLIELI